MSFTLCVDFCADRDYFEQYRGTPGSWEQVRNCLGQIVARPELSHIHLSVTDISSYTIREPKEVGQRLRLLQERLMETRLRVDS